MFSRFILDEFRSKFYISRVSWLIFLQLFRLREFSKDLYRFHIATIDGKCSFQRVNNG